MISLLCSLGRVDLDRGKAHLMYVFQAVYEEYLGRIRHCVAITL